MMEPRRGAGPWPATERTSAPRGGPTARRRSAGPWPATERISAPRGGPTARRRADASFSLLELLVAMSIFSLIGVGLVTLLSRTSEFTRIA